MWKGIQGHYASKYPKTIGAAKAFGKFHNFAMGEGVLGNAIGTGFVGLGAYQGYREGGIVGAAKGIAENYVSSIAFRALPLPVALALLAGYIGGNYLLGKVDSSVGEVGAGAFRHIAGPYTGGSLAGAMFSRQVREHTRKRARLEMGSPVQDQYGTVATMRQRSIMAMRTSKINARGALGMEANNRFQPY